MRCGKISERSQSFRYLVIIGISKLNEGRSRGLDLPFPLLLLRSSRMCLENVVHLPLKVEKKHIDNIRPPRCARAVASALSVPSN